MSKLRLHYYLIWRCELSLVHRNKGDCCYYFFIIGKDATDFTWVLPYGEHIFRNLVPCTWQQWRGVSFRMCSRRVHGYKLDLEAGRLHEASFWTNGRAAGPGAILANALGDGMRIAICTLLVAKEARLCPRRFSAR